MPNFEKNNWPDVFDCRQDRIAIPDQQTFARYRIKIVAINQFGQTKTASEEVIGYSGEDRPSQAPSNLTVLQVTGSTSAILRWNPVPKESINDHFKGYKILYNPGLMQMILTNDNCVRPSIVFMSHFL